MKPTSHILYSLLGAILAIWQLFSVALGQAIDADHLAEQGTKWVDERRFSEGRPLLIRAIEANRRTGDVAKNPALLERLATASTHLGKLDTAKLLFREALSLGMEHQVWQPAAQASHAIGGIAMMGGKLDTTLHYYRISYSLSQKYEDPYDKMSHNIHMGKIHLELQAYDSADHYFDIASQYEPIVQSDRLLSLLYNTYGVYYGRKEQYVLAAQNILKKIKIGERLKDTVDLAISYSNLAGNFLSQGDLEKAQEYGELGLLFAEKKGLNIYKAHNQNILASIYNRQKRYQEALDMFDQALSIYQPRNLQPFVLELPMDQASILLKMGKNDQAILKLKEIESAAKKAPNKEVLMGIDLLYAKYYQAIGERNESLAYAQKSLEQAKQLDHISGKMAAHDFLSTFYKESKRPQEAYVHLVHHRNLKDSLFSLEKNRAINELEILHDQEKKANEIAQLDAQQSAKKANLEVAARQRLLLALGAALFAIIAGLVWYFSRLKKQNARTLTQKNGIIAEALEEKELLLKEIHHRVKNNLQIISSLLRLQGRSLEDEKAFEAIRDGQNRVKSMALIHQNLYQGDALTGVEAGEYLEKLIDSLFRSYNINESQITLTKEVEKLKLDVDTIVPLGLIVNELIINALKHAFPGNNRGEIQIKLKEEANALVLEVADNGIGIPKDFSPKDSSSFGYRLIRAFGERLKATLSIEGNSGTLVKLLISNYKLAT